MGDLVCLLFQFSIFVYKHGFGSVFPLLPPEFFYHVPVCRKSFTTGCHCLIALNICFSEALKKLSPCSYGLLILNQGSVFMQHPMFNVVNFDSNQVVLIFNLMVHIDGSAALMVHCSCRKYKLILFAFLLLKSL